MFAYQVCKPSYSRVLSCVRMSLCHGYCKRYFHHIPRSFLLNLSHPSFSIFSPSIFQGHFHRSIQTEAAMDMEYDTDVEFDLDSEFDFEMTLGSVPCKAKHAFNNTSDSKTLSFRKGDKLIATHRRGAWWFGKVDLNDPENKYKKKVVKGWFPGDYVKVDVCLFYPECSKRPIDGFKKCQEHLNEEWSSGFKKTKKHDPKCKDLDKSEKAKQKAKKMKSGNKKGKKKLKVYTKTGDGGTTSLFNTKRVSKKSDYFDALGNNDELNAQLGVCLEHIKDSIAPPHSCKIMEKQIYVIQRCLFDIGSHIATPKSSSSERLLKLTQFKEENVDHLEMWIDDMENQLPLLKEFILPSGGYSSASLHLARTIARKAERSVIPLFERGDINEGVQKYLNRLSDYLFVCARFIAMKETAKEMTYKKARAKNIDVSKLLHNPNFKEEEEFSL